MKKTILKLFDMAIVLSVVLGIGIHLYNAATFYDRFNLFTYYTIQSNVFMFLLCFRSLIFGYSSKLYNIIRVGSTLIITITGSVYHLLLAPIHHPTGLDALANILLHYLVPILSVVSWLFLVKKNKLSWKTPFIWLIYPVVYFIGTMLRGYYSNVYPYWFINPTRQRPDGIGSYPALLLVVLMLSMVYMILGAFFTWINNRLVLKDR